MKKNIRKRDFILISVLIGLFLTTIIFNSMTPIDLNSNGDDFDEINTDVFKLPKTSGTEINITTPENDTYTAPMSGYYLGSHGFEDVADGSLRSDYIYKLGGTSPEPSKCGAQVVSYKTDAVGNRHDKVIELKDYSSSSTTWISAYFLQSGATDARNCTIEFYNLINKDSGAFYRSFFGIKGDLGWIARFQWYKWSASGNPDIRYWDGATDYDSGIDQTYNRWYRYSIDISCDGGYAGLGANQWRFRVYDEDGILVYTSAILNFEDDHPTGGPCFYRMTSSESQYTIREYVDAIGITGLEDNYQIGDNKEEGLLLSFNSDTALDWMGYSLDGQENKTISGNKTIPMPADGLHTIQVFGEDTLGAMVQSDVRYFTINTSSTSSNPFLNIITPENKTYTAPMSGYYPASFGFENDNDDSFPDGWIDVGHSSCESKVIASQDGHNKVMQLYDGTTSGSAVADNVFTAQTYGTIELWARYSDTSKNSIIRLRQGDTNVIHIYAYQNYIEAYDGPSSYNNTRSIEINTWYHIRIDFECRAAGGYQGLSQYKYHLYIDNEYYGDYRFSSNQSNINTLRIKSAYNDIGYYYWVDAIGYSWDPNYNIGDNKEKGLLVSFNSDTALDWIGYSLDGQENKTISGNKTIPMPADGLHTIQVFGEDTLGTMVQSDVRYFTINKSSNPFLNIITPENKTYTGMGYYPATYGFENDPTGSGVTPSGWTHWQPSQYGVYENIGGHKKVYGMYKADSLERRSIQTFTDGGQPTGTVEFYMRTDDATQYANYELYYDFNPPGTYSWPLMIRFYEGDIKVNNGTHYTILTGAESDRWYHVRVDFRMTGADPYLGLAEDTMRVYLDDVDKGTFGCRGAYPSVNQIHVKNCLSSSGMNMYIDALGYSWDPDYNIGDNKEEGLLLSFNSEITLDWIGYSLDGQENKTISGNKYIPMPAEGAHTIQVFGNDSLGTMYQSDMRHFSIDINSPNSSISFTPHKEDNKVNSTTLFTLSADDGLGSGVSAIMYKINDSGWIEYNAPFDLSGYAPGQYNISFYAFDLLGHFEKINSIIVELLDIEAPISWIIFIAYFEFNKVNITTIFILIADDGFGSGVFAIMYKINDSDWTVYTMPFNLCDYDPGQYNISFYTFDFAGNIMNTKSLIVELVDIDTGPDITPVDDDDDDDDNDDKNGIIIIIIIIFIGIASVSGIAAGSTYVTIRKKKEQPKLKKKLPEKIKLQAKEKFLNKHLTINNLKLSGQNPEEIKMVLEKIFRNKEDRDLILYKLTSLPEGFFTKFKKSYDKSIKELEKSEYVLNNDNYFDEGKGKSE